MPSIQGSITFTLHFVEEVERIAQQERERLKAESSKEPIKTGLELAESEEAKKAKARADLAAQKEREKEEKTARKAQAQPSSGGSSLFGKQFATPNPSGLLKVQLDVPAPAGPLFLFLRLRLVSNSVLNLNLRSCPFRCTSSVPRA